MTQKDPAGDPAAESLEAYLQNQINQAYRAHLDAEIEHLLGDLENANFIGLDPAHLGLIQGIDYEETNALGPGPQGILTSADLAPADQVDYGPLDAHSQAIIHAHTRHYRC